MWTIRDLEVLFHHHCSSAAWRHEGFPAYGDSVRRLVEAGLLEYRDGIPKTTDLGIAFIDLVRATPVPVARYVDPRFERDAA